LASLVGFSISPAAAKPQLVLRPGPREAIEGVTDTRNTLVVNLSENVKGAAYVYRHGATGWTRTRLALPDNATIALGSASQESDELFVTVSSYLLPNSLWLADAATGSRRRGLGGLRRGSGLPAPASQRCPSPQASC